MEKISGERRRTQAMNGRRKRRRKHRKGERSANHRQQRRRQGRQGSRREQDRLRKHAASRRKQSRAAGRGTERHQARRGGKGNGVFGCLPSRAVPGAAAGHQRRGCGLSSQVRGRERHLDTGQSRGRRPGAAHDRFRPGHRRRKGRQGKQQRKEEPDTGFESLRHSVVNYTILCRTIIRPAI